MIKCKKVCFSYPHAHHESVESVTESVLHDIDLEIKKDEFVAIIGENGCGKSTLVKLFNGLLKPSSGQVYVDDENLDSADLYKVRQKVGLCFQSPDNQLTQSQVLEDVAFAPSNLNLTREQVLERAHEALDLVGMSDFSARSVHTLSGGQKQRVAIAGVLSLRPQMLVLDEPTSMLDPHSKEEVLNVLVNLHNKGTGIVLITHDIDEVLLSDRVIIMNKGSIILDCKKDELLDNLSTLLKLNLPLPYATKLLLTLRANDIKVKVKESDMKKAAKLIASVKA